MTDHQPPGERPYRADLAYVHDREFGRHGDTVAAGVLALLEPVRRAGGVVLEVGAGTGALTAHLVAAGHRVIATDGSPAMVARGRTRVPGAVDWRLLVLPDDPVPAADAVVAVGHPLNYLPDAAAVDRALVALAGALRPGGVLALDVCDLSWGDAAGRASRETQARFGDDWVLVTRFSMPDRTRYVRDLTTFVRRDDGSWRRDDERHDTVLVDVGRLPGVLAGCGVEARVGRAFGDEELPPGLLTLVGRRPVPIGAGLGGSADPG